MEPWVVVELLFEAEALESIAVLESALAEVAVGVPERMPVVDVVV